MQKSKVYIVGTCRAFDICRNTNEIEIVNRGDIFSHSTKEIINFLDYKTRKNIPSHLLKYFKHKPNLFAKQKEADIFIIEVSSFRCAKVDEFYFKYHGNNLKKFSHKLSPRDLNNDLKEICKLIPHKTIIFIPHINIVQDNKPIIPGRQKISDMLRDFVNSQARDDIYIFDPSDYIGEDYLEYVDEPIYHYTEKGKSRLGEAFGQFLKDNAI